ncbi:MAG: ABC transporter permease [Clostridia bacterium]|nr:ABC transporter permease [Clostridia bacterium]
MKDFISLKILDKFSFAFEKFGVDYKIMRKILQIKLIMDCRRVPTIMTSHKKDDEDKNFLVSSLISYVLVGLVAMVIVISSLSLFVKMSFCLGMILFMITTTMIADFSSVLLDVKDKNILQCRPIDSKTINTAKAIHIFIYIFIITMATAGPSIIAGTIKHGIIFFIIFFFVLLLSSVFIIFVTSLMYSLILNFFDGEKLKDIINYVQIMLTIVLIIGYQFVGRMFNVSQYDVVFTPKWWIYFLPPSWFAAPFQLFVEKDFGNHYIYLSLLGIIIPIISFIVYTKVIVPYFEKNLSKLNNNSTGKNRFTEIRERLQWMIGKILCFNKMENIFFRFTQKMILNERKLKLRIYPNASLAAVMPLIIIFRTFGHNRTFSEVIGEIARSKSYFSIYMSILLLSNLIIMIKTSEKYGGAWIYRVLPIEEPSPIYRGAFKAFLVQYIIPAYLVPSIVFLVICGPKIFIDMAVMLLNLILVSSIIFKISSRELPFSMDFNHIKSSNIMALIISLVYCGLSIALHMFLKPVANALLVYSGVLIIAIILFWTMGMKIKWKDVI